MIRKTKIVGFVLILISLLTISFAQAQTSKDTLNQYIADLQKNPNNQALREKIIKLVQGMKPVPKVPNEVDELIGKATYIFKNAKSEAEFNDAVEAYQKALLIAPWVPEYYFNLGTVQEKAEKFKEAVESLNLYLLAAPEAKDAKEVREHIGGLKYAAEKGTKGSTPENKYEAWLKNLNGRQYHETRDPSLMLEVKGKSLVRIGPGVDGQVRELGQWELIGRTASTPRMMVEPPQATQVTFTISEDDERIIEHRDFSDGDVREFVWLWQK